MKSSKKYSAVIIFSALLVFFIISNTTFAQSDISTYKEKTFIEKLQFTLQGGTTFESIELNQSQSKKLSINVFGVYSFDDNFKAGLGYQSTSLYEDKISSIYATGLVQSSGKVYIPYARISAGVDFKRASAYQPGLMAGISAGLNCMTAKNLAFNLEFGIKSFNFHYPPSTFTLFNQAGEIIGSGGNTKGSNYTYTMLDASIGLSYSFGK
ncbi:MAG: hypothetical protein JST55_14810 [Bacteroidetes bacterium]|nr:hypothetical protein [Bacteroidota bacterium]